MLLNFNDFLFEQEQQNFGISFEGDTRYVIVAPHAVEADDENTKEIALELAKKLNAYCIINDVYHKPCKDKCDKDEDFNSLPPEQKGIYQWNERVPAMKSFYDTLQNYCSKASVKSADNNKRCLVLFIHGLVHGDIDLDIGAGLKAAPNMVINSEQHVKAKENSGDMTAPVKFVETMKSEFDKTGINTGTGSVFSGWGKQNGTQYLRNLGNDCYSVQLEINKNLRDSPDETASKIASVISKLTDFSEKL